MLKPGDRIEYNCPGHPEPMPKRGTVGSWAASDDWNLVVDFDDGTHSYVQRSLCRLLRKLLPPPLPPRKP